MLLQQFDTENLVIESRSSAQKKKKKKKHSNGQYIAT